jgi:hypothetical protein
MQVVQVLALEDKSGIGKKSGAAYKMTVCQAVLKEDGKPVGVGELVLPKDHAAIKPGEFTVTTKMGRGMDGKLVPLIVALVPVKA